MARVILALDTATVSGYAVGALGERPRSGLIGLTRRESREDVEAALIEFREYMLAIISRTSPDIVVFEQPILPAAQVKFVGPKRRPVAVMLTNVWTLRLLYGLTGTVGLVCHDAGIECREAHIGKVKKAWTGIGTADKQLMLDTARARGFEIDDNPSAHNEADALAVWYYMAEQLQPGAINAVAPALAGPLFG